MKTGAGTLVLTGSNTYSGGTTITAGTLQLGDGVSSNGSIARSVTDNATLTFANPAAQTFSGAIKGSGIVAKAGTGILTLPGADTYTGGTTVSDGTVELAGPAALPARGIINVGRPGTVDLTSLLASYVPSLADMGTDETSPGASPADTPADEEITGQAATSFIGSPAEVSIPETGLIIGRVTVASVPEPSAFALLGAGAIGLLGYLRRRKKG